MRDRLANLEIEDRAGPLEIALVKIAGKLRDPAAAPLLRALLARLPSQGGFETSLHFDSFIGAITFSLREIGDAEAASVLAPFAASSTRRMRNARVESLLTITCVAPDAFTDEMAERALEFVAQVNDANENAKALLALAKGKPGFPGAMDAQPRADRYPQVRFAKALAQGDEAAARSELVAIFTKLAYDHDGTIERRWFGVLAHQLFGLLPEPEILRNAVGLDPELDAELARLGGFEPPRRLTWFEGEDMDSAELQQLLSPRAECPRARLRRTAGTRRRGGSRSSRGRHRDGARATARQRRALPAQGEREVPRRTP